MLSCVCRRERASEMGRRERDEKIEKVTWICVSSNGYLDELVKINYLYCYWIGRIECRAGSLKGREKKNKQMMIVTFGF